MEDDDEDFKRAIALSLEEATKTPPRKDQTPDSDDDEVEAQFQRELQAAVEASKAEGSSSKPTTAPQESVSKPDESNAPEPSPKASFLNDRAQMEKARLERLKRLRGEDIAGSQASNSGSSGPPAKRQRNSPPVPPPATTPVREAEVVASVSSASIRNGKGNAVVKSMNGASMKAGPSSSPSPPASARYWKGELRPIANKHVDLSKETIPPIRMSDILSPKSEISFAILSSYGNKVEWINEFFDESTPVILVNQPDDGNTGLTQLSPNILMTKPFLRNGRGCMHIKLMLVFFKDGHLRVAVPTANFIDYDWRDIENAVWLQDVRKRETPIRHDAKATDFPATLQHVLHALHVSAALTRLVDGAFPNLPIEAISELRMRWDWSDVKAKLVASLPGKHEGWDKVERTGHPALMTAVRGLDARPPNGQELVLECQGSSIGTYSTQWVNEFFCSARGESARVWLDKPKAQRAKLPWPNMKILFPSLQTVKNSVLGLPGGGTMFCRKNQWEGKNFPRHLFHDSNSKRARVLMHTKMILGIFKDRNTLIAGSSSSGTGNGKQSRLRPISLDTDSEDDVDSGAENEVKDRNANGEQVAGWAYVGSHNFTPSAWGTLSGTTSHPVLNITNYELGVVLPLRSAAEADAVACWVRPARKYVEGIDRAWMQEEFLP